MSIFPVPVAHSQLDQFKKQATTLGEIIHAIIGGKILRGSRALNLYAVAAEHSSYNALIVAAKSIKLKDNVDDTLYILQDERLPTMAENIAKYSSAIDTTQAFQALVNLRSQTSLGHLGSRIAVHYQ